MSGKRLVERVLAEDPAVPVVAKLTAMLSAIPESNPAISVTSGPARILIVDRRLADVIGTPNCLMGGDAATATT